MIKCVVLHRSKNQEIATSFVLRVAASYLATVRATDLLVSGTNSTMALARATVGVSLLQHEKGA